MGGEQTWPGVQESGRLVRLGAPSASGNEKLMECKHGEQAVLLPPGHVVFNFGRSAGRSAVSLDHKQSLWHFHLINSCLLLIKVSPEAHEEYLVKYMYIRISG